MTVGNHEFDAGDDVLATFVSMLPFLSGKIGAD